MAGMERFTQRARRVLSLAHQEAEKMHQEAISTEHLLMGLMQEEGGVAGRVLRDLGLDQDRIREMIERLGGKGESESKRLDLTPGVQQVLEMAIEEARQMGHHYIGTEHILLALVRSDQGLSGDVIEKIRYHTGTNSPANTPCFTGRERNNRHSCQTSRKIWHSRKSLQALRNLKRKKMPKHL